MLHRGFNRLKKKKSKSLDLYIHFQKVAHLITTYVADPGYWKHPENIYQHRG